jgi:hypothetical protein
MHTPYGCRHSGACCSSQWPIPLERHRVDAIAAAVADRRLVAPAQWLRHAPHQPADVAGVLAIEAGHCVFHQRGQHGDGGRCAIHGVLGHGAMPTACQHFPRECLMDDRGGFVTLSHYCPTAARLLVSHTDPIEIVEGPTPIPYGVGEGFDARGAWPPLLRPGVLMDHASFSAWEAHMVSWLGGTQNPDGRWSPECVVNLLHSQGERLSRWSPRDGALLDAVQGLADERPWPGGHTKGDAEAPFAAIAREWRALAPIINRFLAAHAFASWTAYQGNGIIVHTRKLRHVADVLRQQAVDRCASEGGALTTARLIEAIRQTDLQLVHLADRDALATALCAPHGP